jgi:hypothetical protein
MTKKQLLERHEREPLVEVPKQFGLTGIFGSTGQDSRLYFSEKILLGKLCGLSRLKGYCFASNKTLGDDMELSDRQIRRLLARLKMFGYIKTLSVRKGDTEKFDRRIYVRQEVLLENGTDVAGLKGWRWPVEINDDQPSSGKKRKKKRLAQALKEDKQEFLKDRRMNLNKKSMAHKKFRKSGLARYKGNSSVSITPPDINGLQYQGGTINNPNSHNPPGSGIGVEPSGSLYFSETPTPETPTPETPTPETPTPETCEDQTLHVLADFSNGDSPDEVPRDPEEDLMTARERAAKRRIEKNRAQDGDLAVMRAYLKQRIIDPGMLEKRKAAKERGSITDTSGFFPEIPRGKDRGRFDSDTKNFVVVVFDDEFELDRFIDTSAGDTDPRGRFLGVSRNGAMTLRNSFLSQMDRAILSSRFGARFDNRGVPRDKDVATLSLCGVPKYKKLFEQVFAMSPDEVPEKDARVMRKFLKLMSKVSWWSWVGPGYHLEKWLQRKFNVGKENELSPEERWARRIEVLTEMDDIVEYDKQVNYD